MKIKSIVKVMNFYSLFRVDSSKKKAEKYFGYEQAVKEFIDNILNNRNLILDKKMIEMNDKGKELNIYIANDLGFCGSFNSNINEVLRQDKENDKIIIGKKISKGKNYDNTILSMTKEEYFQGNGQIDECLFKGIVNQKYKSINIIYNHYYNVSRIERIKKQILPLEKSNDQETYIEDFVVEGNIDNILINIITLYLSYEITVAVENSYASENIMRQATTKESLKKIDEIEEKEKIQERKERNAKSLKKQLDNLSKMNLET